MSGGQWQALNYPAVATAPVAVKAAASATGPDVNRCRSLTVSVSGDGTNESGILQAVLRDGATGVGTIIWTSTIQADATGSASIFLTGVDFRSSIGNALTLELTAAPGGTGQASAAMSGDIVPSGFVVGSN